MFTLATLAAWCSTILGKIIAALVVYLIGKALIKKVVKFTEDRINLKNVDPTVSTFTKNLLRTGLYVLLAVIIVSILGIPMASVITVLASLGLAVGMAMQGSLSNLAGGIMLLIFRPFGVSDYISAAGAEGTVTDISILYTTLITVDNRKIMVPNGSMMASNVVNFSQDKRRVDLTFHVAKGEDIEKIRSLMLDVMNRNEKVIQEPAPFAELSGGTSDSMEFTTRAWCEGSDYWTVYFELINQITKALGEAAVKTPAIRIIQDR